jgi:hypothetical protein
MAKLAHFDASLFIYDFPHGGLICRKDLPAGRRETIACSNLFANKLADS